MGLLAEAGALSERIVGTRRAIHRHPEIGFNEERTSALVAERLGELGVEFAKMAGTGLVATIRPDLGASAVALRADMDAIPVPEETGFDFASEVEGISHACGHDSHVAMLLAAAELILAHAEELEHPVKLLFQPAEEVVPGGARKMIEEGCLEGVAEIHGIHVNPDHLTGELGVRVGPMMAAMDSFALTVTGRGGHGAMPHQTRDPVHASARVITALQQISSRRVDPLDPVVVSVCAVHGGNAFNVIPDKVEMKGTCRTLSASLHEKLPGMIEEVATRAAQACGCEAELGLDRGTPVLENERGSYEKLTGRFRSLGGTVHEIQPTMGGEDFAYYLQKVPGAFAFLGVGGDGSVDRAKLHSGRLNIDEEALPLGAALLASMALAPALELVE